MATEFDASSTAARPDRLETLSTRIAWICQLVRLAAVAYAVWLLYVVVAYWSSIETINDNYGRILKKDLSGVAAWQQGAALSVHLVLWALAALLQRMAPLHPISARPHLHARRRALAAPHRLLRIFGGHS